jgi:tripartite-type tricarboxylate transporter receptor subunit TctC
MSSPTGREIRPSGNVVNLERGQGVRTRLAGSYPTGGRRPGRLVITALVASAMVTACGGDESSEVSAAPDENPYAGETVTFVVPYDPGGGYDVYARVMAPYLEEALDATVVVENQPGAGGLVAISSLAQAGDDPNTIAIMNGAGNGAAVLAGAPGANFDLDGLSYVARIADEPLVLLTRPDGEFTTMEDVAASEGFRFGSTGLGSSDYIGAEVVTDAMDLEGVEIITGFKDSSTLLLAVLQGDVDGYIASYGSAITQVESGEAVPVLTVGRERLEDMPDSPHVLELDLDREEQAVVEGYLALVQMARPVVAAPEIGETRLAALRDAMGEVLQNREFLAEMEQQQRPISYLPGEELEELVKDLVDDVSPAFEELLVASFAG